MLKMSSILKFLACLVLITAFMGCSSTRTQSSTGEYVDDSVITAKIKAAYVADSELKSYQIDVETYKGVVQLSGFVDNKSTVTKAGEVARGINGVKGVKNNLIVK